MFVPAAFAVCATALVSPVRPALAHAPVADLPRHVPAEAGKLTLYADFAAKNRPTGTPVYLVNRTDKPVAFAAQDGDIYLKLEYEAAPGRWVRAESHQDSECGNSYRTRTLESGRFWVLDGYVPKAGAKGKVRYGLHLQPVPVASNTGDGGVDPADVAKAAGDLMALREAEFGHLKRVAVGEVVIRGGRLDPGELRRAAVDMLYFRPFDPADKERALRAVADGLAKTPAPSDDDRKLAEWVGGLLSCLEKERSKK